MATLRELLNKVSNSKLSESCKSKKKESKTGKKGVSAGVAEKNALTVEALSALLDMVNNGSLTEAEVIELQASIETVFNNVLEESYDDEEYDYSDEYEDEYSDEYEDDEYSDEDEEYTPEFVCTNEECDWEGYAEELTEEGTCPACGSEVTGPEYNNEESEEEAETAWANDEEEYEEEYEDEEMKESILNKTTAADKKASKAYRKSAEGKKSLKLSAKKRAKYATKISRCSEAGKTFSFKTLSCVKPNKRR